MAASRNRECSECGAAFELKANAWQVKTCSEVCRLGRERKTNRAYRLRNTHPKVIRRACLECGNNFSFVSRTGHQPELCSVECRLERARRVAIQVIRNQWAAAGDRHCKICNAVIPRGLGRRTFCSPACYRVEQLANVKKWTKDNPARFRETQRIWGMRKKHVKRLARTYVAIETLSQGDTA